MNIAYNNELPDITAYFDLFETTGWNKRYRATPQDLLGVLQASSFMVCVYDHEKLVGFGRLLLDGLLHGTVYDLIVRPEYQGRGIGSKILGHLVDHCREKNIHDIQLFAAQKTVAFYEKCGFRPRPADAPGMQYQL